MRSVPALHVERLDNKLRYRLEVPDRDVGEPLQEEFNHRLDHGAVLSLQQSADRLLRGVESAHFEEEARRTGSVLYRTLVPRRLRSQLNSLPGPLLVSTSLYGLPWELFHDDREFWGLRYALGKRLVTDRPVPISAGVQLRTRPRALVIGSDSRGDLPFVRDEVESICTSLERLADVCCVSGPMATFSAISAYLGEGFDIIHYCGHAVVDRQAGPCLLLADEKPISAAVIEFNVKGRPLVFLNACASVRGEPGEPTSDWEETFSSVAHGFLFGGASAVVGTLCDVSDRDAAGLAAAFYEHVLEPVSVGEALRLARVSCRRQRPNSPAWLSFVLHGNPAQTLAVASTEPGAEHPRATVPDSRKDPSERPPHDRTVQRVSELRTSRRTLLEAAVAALPLARRAWLAVLVVLALGLSVAVGLVYYLRTPPEPVGPLVVGVMEIRPRGDVPDWMLKLTRDSLITVLSKVGTLEVMSSEMIDFWVRTRGLSEIEAAEEMRITSFISGAISLSESTVTLWAQVVDPKTGWVKAAERVQGQRDRLINLQNELAGNVLGSLNVALSDDDIQTVLGKRSDEDLDSYKLFTETLGGLEEEPEQQSEYAPLPENESRSLPWIATAWADNGSPDEIAIRSVLDQYRAALEAEDIAALSAVHVMISERQQAALERYFANASELVVKLTIVDILVEGDEALATFTREDVFKDARSGREVQLEVRISSILVKQDGTWKIRGLKRPS